MSSNEKSTSDDQQSTNNHDESPFHFTVGGLEMLANSGFTEESFTEMANRERESYLEECQAREELGDEFYANEDVYYDTPTEFVKCTHSTHAYNADGAVTCDTCEQQQTNASGDLLDGNECFYHNGSGKDLCLDCYLKM